MGRPLEGLSLGARSRTRGRNAQGPRNPDPATLGTRAGSQPDLHAHVTVCAQGCGWGRFGTAPTVPGALAWFCSTASCGSERSERSRAGGRWWRVVRGSWPAGSTRLAWPHQQKPRTTARSRRTPTVPTGCRTVLLSVPNLSMLLPRKRSLARCQRGTTVCATGPQPRCASLLCPVGAGRGTAQTSQRLAPPTLPPTGDVVAASACARLALFRVPYFSGVNDRLRARAVWGPLRGTQALRTECVCPGQIP